MDGFRRDESRLYIYIGTYPLIPYMGQRRGIAHGHTKKAAKRVA